MVQNFNVAYDSYQHFKAGSEAKENVALSIRTFLDGVQGELFEKARSVPRENMTFNEMVTRLKLVSESPSLRMQLVWEAYNRAKIYGDLSSILKQRERQSVRNLDYIWTSLLDHLFVLLEAIDWGEKEVKNSF